MDLAFGIREGIHALAVVDVSCLGYTSDRSRLLFLITERFDT